MGVIYQIPLIIAKIVPLNLFGYFFQNLKIPKHGGQSDVRNDIMLIF